MDTIHYQVGTTAKKGAKEGVYTIGAGGFAALILTTLRNKGWLPWGPELDLYVVGLLTGSLAGVLKIVRNFAKEHGFDWLFGPTRI